jgi:hypothetical protein
MSGKPPVEIEKRALELVKSLREQYVVLHHHWEGGKMMTAEYICANKADAGRLSCILLAAEDKPEYCNVMNRPTIKCPVRNIKSLESEAAMEIIGYAGVLLNRLEAEESAEP